MQYYNDISKIPITIMFIVGSLFDIHVHVTAIVNGTKWSAKSCFSLHTLILKAPSTCIMHLEFQLLNLNNLLSLKF